MNVGDKFFWLKDCKGPFILEVLKYQSGNTSGNEYVQFRIYRQGWMGHKTEDTKVWWAKKELEAARGQLRPFQPAVRRRTWLLMRNCAACVMVLSGSIPETLMFSPVCGVI